MKILIVFIIFIVLLLLMRRNKTQLKGLIPVTYVDYQKYLGTWYEIGRIDSSFEPKGMKDVTATYSANSDGTIKVVNRGNLNGKVREAVGKARKTEKDGVLKVSFFPFVESDYVILYLDDTISIVGTPSRELLWLLSRSKTYTADTLTNLLEVARQNGYTEEHIAKFHIVE